MERVSQRSAQSRGISPGALVYTPDALVYTPGALVCTLGALLCTTRKVDRVGQEKQLRISNCDITFLIRKYGIRSTQYLIVKRI